MARYTKQAVGISDVRANERIAEARAAAAWSRGCRNCSGRGYIGEVQSQLCGDCYGMNEDTHGEKLGY